jgi:hypothetical protein
MEKELKPQIQKNSSVHVGFKQRILGDKNVSE